MSENMSFRRSSPLFHRVQTSQIERGNFTGRSIPRCLSIPYSRSCLPALPEFPVQLFYYSTSCIKLRKRSFRIRVWQRGYNTASGRRTTRERVGLRLYFSEESIFLRTSLKTIVGILGLLRIGTRIACRALFLCKLSFRALFTFIVQGLTNWWETFCTRPF